MSRKQPKTIPREERAHMLDTLWTMIALLETRDDVENFFRDLLSETEAVMLARRIIIATRLLQGDGYDTICSNLGASPATVASVHRWLQQGKGYQNLLPKLQKEQERLQKVKERDLSSREQFTFAWMKKKYPLHFLLLNLIDEVQTRAPKKIRKSGK